MGGEEERGAGAAEGRGARLDEVPLPRGDAAKERPIVVVAAVGGRLGRGLRGRGRGGVGDALDEARGLLRSAGEGGDGVSACRARGPRARGESVRER